MYVPESREHEMLRHSLRRFLARGGSLASRSLGTNPSAIC